MMKSLSLLSLVLVASSAWGSPFVTLEEGGQHLKDADRVSRAVGHINIDTNCSAVRISDEGHILTNFHCVYACAPGKLIKGNKVKYFEINEPVEGVECKSDVFSKGEPSPYAWSGKATFVATGSKKYMNAKAVATLSAEPLSKSFAEGFDGLGYINDFAIIKMDVPPSGTCLKVGNDMELQPSDKLSSLSYPFYVDGNGGYHYYEPRVSTGAKLKSWSEYELLDKALQRQKLDVTSFEKLHAPPAVLWSTLDGNNGSSGSPVLNAEGKIVALTFAVGKSADTYVRGSHKSIRISHIVKNLKAQLGEDRVREIFNCTAE